MSVVLQTGVMHYRENDQDEWHPLIIKAQSIDLEALVDPYDASAQKTWAQGEYCLYDDKIWRCVNQVTTPADFDEDDWVQTTFAYEIEQIGAGLASEATTRANADTALQNTLNQLCLRGQKTAISANGTTSNISCTGLTANHKVCNWGLFSDNDLTTPLDPNNPPADITITEKADAYDITITNFTSAFYIQPIFIIPQN